MISKQFLLDGMLHECTVTQHLFSKFRPDGFDYRPSGEQRTTTDLLRYLSVIGIAGTTCIAEQDWKRFGEFTARSAALAPADFVPAMDRQKAELVAFFAGVTEQDLETRQGALPGGAKLPLGAALMNGPFKWLTAYKLQLFLYAKAAGARDIGTLNAWQGKDKPPA